MEGFEWMLEIKDGMQAPASTMKSALKSVEGAMRATEAEMRSLQRLQNTYSAAGFRQGAAEVGKDLSKLRLGLAETRAQYKQLQGAQGDGASGLDLAKSAAGALGLAMGLREVVHWELEAVRGMGELVAEGVKLALEANELREHTTRMFSGLGGSESVGEEMYRSIQKLRTVLPESEKELSSWAAKLMGAGMVDPRSVNESIKAMSSASALMGGGEQGQAAADKIGNLIAKSLEGGKFKGMAKTLVGTGVSADDLAKQLGMSPAAFQAAFKKGTIAADKGIDALNDVLQRKGRAALEGTMGELPVMALKAREAWAHMFDGINVRPLTDMLRVMVGVLDTGKPSGLALKDTLTSAFNSIIKLAGDMAHAMLLGFLYAELAILKLEHAFSPLIAATKKWIDSGAALSVFKGVLWGMAAALTLIAATIAVCLGPVMLLVNAFYSLTDGIGAAVDKALDLKSAITGTPRPQMDAGGAGGSDWGAPKTSPAHATGGVVGKPAPGEYFASVAPGETIVPKGGMQALSGSSESTTTSSKTVTVDVGGIHLNGTGKSAGEILEMLESAVADLFDRAALEAGS